MASEKLYRNTPNCYAGYAFLLSHALFTRFATTIFRFKKNAVYSVYGCIQAKQFLLTPRRYERGKGFFPRKHYKLPQHTHAAVHKTDTPFRRSQTLNNHIWAFNPCNMKKTSWQISHHSLKTPLLHEQTWFCATSALLQFIQLSTGGARIALLSARSCGFQSLRLKTEEALRNALLSHLLEFH